MPDVLTPEQRQHNMRRIRGKNTGPELLVRRLLHKEGFRYRLHSSELPGRPDIVFPKMRKAVFVHGCFWHRHEGCPKAATPMTRAMFWQHKFKENVERDARAYRRLWHMGWKIFIVWECEVGDRHKLMYRLREFLAE